MSTLTKIQTIEDALNEADPNLVADALRQIKFGDMLSVQEQTIVQTAAATLQIPAMASGEGVVDAPGTAAGTALYLQSVRVVAAGTAALGARIISDEGATPDTTHVAYNPATGVLTFEGTVTQVRVIWVPGPVVAMTTAFGGANE